MQVHILVSTESGASYNFIVEGDSIACDRRESTYRPSYDARTGDSIGNRLLFLERLPVIQEGKCLLVRRKGGGAPITSSPVKSILITTAGD